MDIAIAGQHLDLTSLAVGAVAARAIEATIVRAIKPLPRLAVAFLKNRVKAATLGKIDAPTMRLLACYGRATFAWADAEMPDKPGAEKMAAVLEKLSAVPYLGVAIRADRAGAEEILQAAYDAIKSEAREEAGGPNDAPTIAPQSGGAAPTPAPSPDSSEGGSLPPK